MNEGICLKVGIAGATGYTGFELCRLLISHPFVEISALFANRSAGVAVEKVAPFLRPLAGMTYETLSVEAVEGLDILFLALPHGESQKVLPHLMQVKGLKIVDLSADFRLNSPELFQKYYKEAHHSPELLGKISLGLPELYREDLIGVDVCATPGCYATSVMLGAWPLAMTGQLKRVVSDSKSGVSGAGRGLKEGSLYCEVDGGFSAYSTGVHRHQPEMEMVLGVPVFFSPHLVPMSRGILSTLYCDIAGTMTQDKLTQIYEAAYEGCPFVVVKPDLSNPSTKYVSGTNECWITPKVVDGQIVVFSALDNLIKGASGQAIQCMNLMCGFDEMMGLALIPPYI